MDAKKKRCAKNALMLLLAVGANCLGSFAARHITIPLYLDSVLTIAVTAISGLWWGIACAVLSNGIMRIADTTMFPFVLCHICTVLVAHLTFLHYQRSNRKEPRQSYPIDTFLWAGLWSALTNAVLGNIISQMLYASLTIPNVDNLVQGIFIAVQNLTFATYFGVTLTNLADKMISATLSYAVYRIVCRSA